MNIVTPPLEINQDDPFKNDIFKRGEYAEALTNLFLNSNESLVVSLNGAWGEGKTTFVQMWQAKLKKQGVPSVYIDAFANDYLNEPFVCVVSSILAYADKNIVKGGQDKINDLKNRSKQVGGQLLSWGARMAIKSATLGLIKDSDIEELKDIKDEISTGASDLAGKFVGERISSHSKELDNIASFKQLLSELPIKLQPDSNYPLIVIIDELDRCRPTYAVECLEKIKHLFFVKNVMFLLVLNKQQLEQSIKSIYGNIDSDIYLQKFINIETILPKRIKHSDENHYKRYARHLLTAHGMGALSRGEDIVTCVVALAKVFNFSLRSMEKSFTNLAIFYAASSENSLRLDTIVVFLAVLKVADPKLYEDICFEKVSYADACKRLNFDEALEGDPILYRIMQWVQFAMLTNEEFSLLPSDDEVRGFTKVMYNYFIERDQLMALHTHRMNMFVFND